MDYLDWLQWPAMIVTIAAAWLVGSASKYRRNWGFWVFILSNLLWVAWGWHAQAYALILLQFGLAIMNIRGVCKSAPPTAGTEKTE
ncbi:hypothetical protein LG198_12070 [Methylobacillus arboreus]|uniref:hypothetical protein n=1 Tax=Methylobacillus arboreus TaxID=755170 RepID=UPI001E5D4FBB|nr:hypothetical protein [Methylobacillus arboreus]MCB5191465.1 hypothetical protein [Methylobacillus arboreus]